MTSEHGLSAHGIRNAVAIGWNLSTPALYQHAVQPQEGMVGHLGPLVVRTGPYPGRSPMDRYIVKEPTTQERTHLGKGNLSFDSAA